MRDTAERPEGRASRPIGQILLHAGAASPHQLAAALAAQKASGARLGEVLRRRGWAQGRAVAEAAARQAGTPFLDLAEEPPDPALLDAGALPARLRERTIPWRRMGGRVLHVSDDAVRARLALARRGETGPLALADGAGLNRAAARAWGPALAARAAARPPEALSARRRTPLGWRLGLVAALVLALGLAVAAPEGFALAALATLLLLNALNAGVRVATLGAALRARPEPDAAAEGVERIADRRPPPVVTLLIPLLREPEVVPTLFAALERLDWPAELLDVKLILEEGDAATLAEVERLGAPPFAEVLVAPPGEPRTKPRALNFALDFAEGEIVGIYDAEDRPDPAQIRKVVETLRDAPPEVAAAQCKLGYFNARENWMTRCFALEYMIWFDVLIAGFRDLRLPIPLGGTSVFFRRDALERLGCWDAHNVTEDADLGMRLARAGMRCEVVESTTREEANARLAPWVRQRSRWLKGYAQTWLVHMRRPLRLFRDLGPVGFLGFQTLFLGAMAAYFGLPILWAFWTAALLGHAPDWATGLPLWALGAIAVVQLAGWIAMAAAAVIATARRRETWLLPWLPTLAFYWPLGSLAAYLALVELLVAPTLWRKTTHGVGRIAAAERDAALVERAGRVERREARRAAR